MPLPVAKRSSTDFLVDQRFVAVSPCTSSHPCPFWLDALSLPGLFVSGIEYYQLAAHLHFSQMSDHW